MSSLTKKTILNTVRWRAKWELIWYLWTAAFIAGYVRWQFYKLWLDNQNFSHPVWWKRSSSEHLIIRQKQKWRSPATLQKNVFWDILWNTWIIYDSQSKWTITFDKYLYRESKYSILIIICFTINFIFSHLDFYFSAVQLQYNDLI